MPTVPIRPASRRKEAVPVFPSPECAIRRHRVRSLISVHPDAPFGRREEPADRRPAPVVTMLPSSLFAAKAGSLGLRALATPLPAHTTKLAMSWHERTHPDTAARAFRELVRRVVGEHRAKKCA